MVRRVLAGQRDRGLVQVLGQRQQRVPSIAVPLSVVHFRSSKNCPRQSVRGASHRRRLGRNEIAVVKGDLADVGGHVPDLTVVLLVGPDDGLEEVDGGVADIPLKGVENVHLHLGEHACVVETTAHVVQLIDLGHPVLLVPVLGSDQQRRASH